MTLMQSFLGGLFLGLLYFEGLRWKVERLLQAGSSEVSPPGFFVRRLMLVAALVLLCPLPLLAVLGLLLARTISIARFPIGRSQP